MIENIDFVSCKICGFKGKDIRPHLRLIHNISIDKYKQLHQQEVVCQNTKDKRASSNKLSQNAIEVKKRKSEAMKKRRQEKHWASFGMKGKESWNKGLTKNDERVKKYTKSRNKTMKKKYWSKGRTYDDFYGKNKAERIRQKQAVSAKLLMKNNEYRLKRSINNWMKKQVGKSIEELYPKRHKDMRKKMQTYHRNNPNNIRQSCVELEIKEYLKQLNISFEHDKGLKERHGRPDFLFFGRKKIIEYNGCYWHNHSCVCKTLEQVTDKRVHDTCRNYERKLKSYNDFEILEVWECEWKKDKELQKKRIMEFVKNEAN